MPTTRRSLNGCAKRPGQGRNPRQIGIEAAVEIAKKTPDDWAREVEEWRMLGATHLSVSTMDAGLTTPQAHIDAIRRFKVVIT